MQINAKSPYVYWSALILASYAVLYRLRAFDKNIFSSWDKIFSTGISELFLIFLFCLLLSYVVSQAKFELDEKWDSQVLFFGTFLLGALFWSIPELHPDAARYFAEAKYLGEFGPASFIRNWGGELNVMSDFPLVPFMYGLIFRFLGESKEYIQILLTAMLASTSVLTYLIGKMMWSRGTGLYASLFLISSPYLLSYVFMLPTIPLMFFLTASVFATLNSLDENRGKIWILASSIFIILTVLTKASGILLLSVIPALFLSSYLKTRDRRVLYASASIAMLSGAFISLFVLYKFDVLAGMFPLITAFKARTALSSETSLSLIFFQISPIITLLALSSFFNKKDYNYAALMVWFLVPFIFLYNTRIRFALPLLPAVAIMASLGLHKIQSEKSRNFLAGGIILCSLSVAVFSYLPFMQAHSEINIKNAAAFTDSLNTEGVEVYAILPENFRHDYEELAVRHRHTIDILIPIFDLYSEKNILTPGYGVGQMPPVVDFTWQYNSPPPYYSQSAGNQNAIVLIIPENVQKIPENLQKRLDDRYELARVYSPRKFSNRGGYFVEVYVPVTFI
ncbi:MAG: glycosyltransferase family 39 protein [Candidatus Hydrothermarchaeaceae archaeon]